MAETTYSPRLIVTRDETNERFELRRDHVDAEEELLSFATYFINGRVITVSHVETLVEHRDNNFAAMLMAGMLDDIARWGLRIRPTCSFAASYINDHPDMHYLLAS
jgi:predicted GNAT family acetyltransferase